MSENIEQNIQADDAQASCGGIDANAQLFEQPKTLRPTTESSGETPNALKDMEDLQRQISDLQNNQQKQTIWLNRRNTKPFGRRSHWHRLVTSG